MKTLLIALLCLISMSAFAQVDDVIVNDSNPTEVIAGTNNKKLEFRTGDFRDRINYPLTITIRAYSTNTGWVKFNTYSNGMTKSSKLFPGEIMYLSVSPFLWVDFENTSVDGISIFW